MPEETYPKRLDTQLYDFPREMFVTSYRHFRRIMCSTKYTLEQKDSACDSFVQDYFRCKLTDTDIKSFLATMQEWTIRREYEFFREPLTQNGGAL